MAAPQQALLAGGAASYDSFLVLSVNCNGTNGSTTFTDASSAARAVTANGNAQVSTAQSAAGGASLLCDGTGDFLSCLNSTDFQMGTSEFAVEAYFRTGSTGSDQAIIVNANPTVGATADLSWGLLYFGASLAGKVRFFAVSGSTDFRVDSDFSLSANTWYRIKGYRKNDGKLYMKIDGVAQTGGSPNILANTVNPGVGTAITRVGIYSNGLPRYANGYIDEIKVWKGTTAGD